MRRRHWGLSLTMLVIFGVAMAMVFNPDVEAFLNFWVTALIVGGVVVAAAWHVGRVLYENWAIEELMQREVAAGGIVPLPDCDGAPSAPTAPLPVVTPPDAGRW